MKLLPFDNRYNWQLASYIGFLATLDHELKSAYNYKGTGVWVEEEVWWDGGTKGSNEVGRREGSGVKGRGHLTKL